MSQDEYIYCPRCRNTLILKKIANEEVKICSKCSFIFWDKPKPVVSMIIHKNLKILMLKRSNELFKNFWVLPGGFIMINETPQRAIEKEVNKKLI